MQLLFSFPGITPYISRLSILIMMWSLSGLNPATGQIASSVISGTNPNGPRTAVPFLTIAPDAVSSSLGDAGVASIPDVNSQHWNAARYAFSESRAGVSASLTPWLNQLIPGMYHMYTSAFYRINEKNGISGSFRYFELGTIYASSATGGPVTFSYHPREFAVDAGYNRMLTDRLAGSVLLRYIQSDLTDNRLSSSGDEIFPGRSLATDLGFYFQDDFQAGEREAQWAFGINLSNLGAPISYSTDADKTPIPSNLRTGARLTLVMNESNTISILTDLNKLMVPSPPVYSIDPVTNERIVVRGKVPPGSVVMGMIQSFYDAPGILKEDGSYSVLAEELHEIMYSLGAEYRYKTWLAIRTGYFHEHASKGNRQYVTLGTGVSFNMLAVDLSYLIPVNGPYSPFQHTFRVTVSTKFGTV